MKKKKYFIIFIIAFLIIMVSMGSITRVYAQQNLGLGDLNQYGEQGSNTQSSSFKGMVENFLGLVSIVGVVLSVVILTIIGLKYMLGSVEDRAQYKEEMKPYLIGCFILFTGSVIPQIIYDIMQAF